MRQFLLQMAGPTGTGKSTLANAIAARTGAIVLDKDVIMAAALRAGAEGQPAAAIAYEVGFDLAHSLLSANHNVILDNPANFVEIRAKGEAIAHELGASYYIIECALAERAEHEARLASRTARHALHPTSLEGVDLDYSRPVTAPIFEPHLTIDTHRSLNEYLGEALEYIGYDLR